MSVDTGWKPPTWREAARKHFEALDKLQAIHTKRFTGNHPHYCINPPMGMSKDSVCQAIEVIESEIEKIRGNEL